MFRDGSLTRRPITQDWSVYRSSWDSAVEVVMDVASGNRNEHRAIVVRKYVAAHLTERLTLPEVGRELGMSESSVRRAIALRWSVGFYSLIEQLRVERALEELAREPHIKVEVLALNVGWRSRGNLYASVQRVTGRSLSALRASPTELAAARRRLKAVA